MKLPGIGNVAGSGKIVSTSPKEAGTTFNVKLNAMTQVSRAKMSEIVNGGAAQRNAIVAKSRLDNAEAQSDIVLANSKAKAAQGTTDTVSSLMNTTADAFLRYDIAQSKTQKSDFLLGQKRKPAEFAKLYGSRETFSRGELSEAVIAKAGIPEGVDEVPAYMVLPDMKREYMDKDLISDAEKIQRSDIREEALAIAQGWEAGEYERELQKSIIQRPIYEAKRAVGSIQSLLDNGEFEQAILFIEETPDLSKEVKIKWLDKATNEKQDTKLTDIGNGDLNEPETIIQLKHYQQLLRDKDPATVGALTNAQRRMHLSRIDSSIKSYNTMQGNKNSAADSQMLYEGRQMVKLAEAGNIPNATQFLTVFQANKNSKNTANQNVARDMAVGKAIGEATLDAQGATLSNMNQIVASIDSQLKNNSNMNTNDATILMKLGENVGRMRNELQNDPLKYARENNLLPIKLWDAENVVGSVVGADMAESWARKQGAGAGHYMEDGQYTILHNSIQGMNSEDKMKVAGQIMVAMKGDIDKASAFLEPMKKLGYGVEWVMAAQMAYKGNTVGAEFVLRGTEDIKRMPELITAVRPEASYKISQMTGTALGYNVVEQGAVLEAVLATYAAMSNGQVDESGKHDKDRLEKAIQLVMGDVVGLNGVKFAAPTPGLNTPAKVESFTDDLTGAYLTGLHPNYNKDKTMKQIQNGEIQLIPTGQNKFVLNMTSSGELVADEFGQKYQFSFHQPDITKSAIQSEQFKQSEFERDQQEIADREKQLATFVAPGDQPGSVEDWVSGAMDSAKAGFSRVMNWAGGQ